MGNWPGDAAVSSAESGHICTHMHLQSIAHRSMCMCSVCN